MEPALQQNEAAPGSAGSDSDAWQVGLWARDVAALLAEQTGQDAKTETITQYVWLRRRHIADKGRARDSDIPEPDGRARPPWRVSGTLYPYWRPDGPILGWIASRQPPGRPRNDDRPRTRRKDTYAKPGRRPAGG